MEPGLMAGWLTEFRLSPNILKLAKNRFSALFSHGTALYIVLANLMHFKAFSCKHYCKVAL